jgi:hypothetical protein
MNVIIPIKYPQKLKLIIEFSIDLNEIDKRNIDLDDFWDDIIECIKTLLYNDGYQILNGSETHINKEYTIISYNIILLGKPPFLNLDDLIVSLKKLPYPKIFAIKINDKYIPEKWQILYSNKI